MSDSGILRVRLSHAIGLRSRDANGFSDPYVKLKLGNNKSTEKKSATIQKSLNPRWDEDFDFRGNFSQIVNEPLHVAVWDYDRFTRNDTLGNGVLHLNQLVGLEGGGQREVVVELKDQQAKPGEVHMFISWEYDDGRNGRSGGGAVRRSESFGRAPRPYPTGAAARPPAHPPSAYPQAPPRHSVNGIPHDIVQTFNHFDANRSGYIDYAELREALRHYGVEASIVQTAELVRRYDDNPDGKLELTEFAELVRDLETHVVRSAPRSPHGRMSGGISGARGSAPARASAIFDEFDVNRSGYLDYKELRGALTRYGINLSTAHAAEMVRRYDSNPDGKLDLYEFQELIRDLEGQGYRDGSAPPAGRGALVSPGVGAFHESRSSMASSRRAVASYAPPPRPTSPYAGRRYPTSVTSPVYAGAAGGERYLAPPPMGGGGGGGGDSGASLEALRYLLDVVFRTLCYALATTAMVAPAQLVGDADFLAKQVGKDSAAALLQDMPGIVWMAMVALLVVLLLVWSNCCGLRRPCLSCFEGREGPCSRCCRALGSCFGGGRAYDRYHDLEGAYGNSWRSPRYGR